jgi:hypothetical protein
MPEVEAYLIKNPSNTGRNSKPEKRTFNNFANRTYDTKLLKEKLIKKGRGELSE